MALTFLVLGACVPTSASAQERQRLAYSHDGRIYSLSADGSGRSLLVGQATRGARFTYGEPEWSPDASALVFSHSQVDRRDDETSHLQIKDGRGTRSLTPLVQGRSEGAPAFSPDGTTIAFSRFVSRGDDLESQILTMPAAGGPARVVVRQRLRSRLMSIGDPRWAPDGRLAYTLSQVDSESKFQNFVFTVGLDGSGRRVLLRDASAPSWSPDGSRLAFASIRDRNGEDCGSDQCSYRGEIYVAGADGSRARRLTRNKGDDGDPTWSADGSRILFTSSRNFPEGGSTELYTITPEGGCLSWLTNGTPGSGSGDWQPGSGSRADAGGCGALGRRALIETPAPRPASPALWLGRSYRGLLLTDSERRRGQTRFDYQDCDRFDPRRCLPGAYLTSTSVCRDDDSFELLRLVRSSRTKRFRGAVLATDRSDGAMPELYTGGIDQTLQVDFARRGDEGTILRGLYRFGSPRSPAGSRLPAPRVSPTRARASRRAVRVSRRARSRRAAAKALGIKPSTLRIRLRLARELAPLRTARCP